MTITLQHPEFRASVAEVRRACGVLLGGTDRAGAQVALLIDGGWTGAAAEEFAQAWADWEAAARGLIGDLERIGGLLVQVRGDLVDADESAAFHVARLGRRLT